MRALPRTLTLLLALTLPAAAAFAQGQSLRGAEPVTAMDETERMLEELRHFLADQFGLPADSVRAGSKLEDDLRAEAMDAWEAVAMFCDLQGVDPPLRTPPTVAQVAAYVLQARRGGGVQASAEPVELLGVELLYGTSRARDDTSDPYLYYGGERAASKSALELGRCRVEIPVAAHRRGHLESPSIWKLERRPDPRKHIVLAEVEALDEAEFLAALRRNLEASGDDLSRDLLVFVHGFNITFAKAARRTAQLAYDLEFPGTPCLFSWPSDGKLLKYMSDREDAEWSVPRCERFLELLLDEVGPGRIHLVAHSMGNQALIRTLYAMALRRGDQVETLFASVILAAPDFDARAFTENIAPVIRPLAERWTVYASGHDKALDASTALSAKRLGLPLSVTPGMDTIDVSGVDVSPWSMPEMHAYYASKARVIADMVAALRRIEPGGRDLRSVVENGQHFWRLASPATE
jgi:esterase/lipase superfamily enzyme